jgi:hypothetical protein
VSHFAAWGSLADRISITSKSVVVRVGKDEEESFIHETLLRANSEVFNTALKEWKEGQERSAELPEAKVEVFKIWVKWLYTGRMFLMKEDDHFDLEDKIRSNEWPRWAKCYD